MKTTAENWGVYTPVFLMAVLVLLSWLPFVVSASRPAPLPVFLLGWSGALDGCNAAIDTSGFVRVADKYRVFVVCRVIDASIDPLADDKIAISKPFQITGALVAIVILYEPNAPIKTVAKIGTETAVHVVLLPKDQDGTNIKRLSDVIREGGQILVPGAKLKD